MIVYDTPANRAVLVRKAPCLGLVRTQRRVKEGLR